MRTPYVSSLSRFRPFEFSRFLLFDSLPNRARANGDIQLYSGESKPSVVLTKSLLEQADVHSSGVQCTSRGLCFRSIRRVIGWVSPFRLV